MFSGRLSKLFVKGGGDNVRYFSERLVVEKFLGKNLGTVLECGAGMGTMHTPFLVRNSEKVVIVEIDEELMPILKQHYPNKPIVRADMQHLPFRDGVFDTVLAVQVIEHLDDDMLGVSEAMRVSKENSRHVYSLPLHVSHDDDLHKHKRYGDKRLYTEETAKELLGGYAIKRKEYSARFFSNMIFRHMLKHGRLHNFVIALSLLDILIPAGKPKFMVVEIAKTGAYAKKN
ncbi:MAG: class I SAM-dependent methyltransferase [Candidatus Aenigmarchaeota archaeon]|nr:class I SAM-dependent methyltransferase [Candidatus Aenigmarchaeota archaeon]